MTINSPGITFFVCSALCNHGCQTSEQLSNYIRRVYGENYSVNSVGSTVRKLIKEGKAASSKDENLKNVYWMTDFGKENFIKENNHA